MARRLPTFAATTGLVSTLALATAALAAPGDTLTIEAGAATAVRTVPGIDTETMLWLYPGDEVVEVERDGAWVKIALPERGGLQGWIHDPLFDGAAATWADAPVPAAADQVRPPAEPQDLPPAEAQGHSPTEAQGRSLVEAQGEDWRGAEMVEIQVQGGANVRAAPTAAAPVVTAVQGGCRLRVLERSGNWIRVGLDGGQDGWIYRELIAAADGVREEAPAGAEGRDDRREMVEIEAQGGANVRAGPTADAPVVTTMVGGCLLPVLERSDGWVYVGLGADQGGWIHDSLLAAVEAPDEAQQVEAPAPRQEETEPVDMVAAPAVPAEAPPHPEVSESTTGPVALESQPSAEPTPAAALEPEPPHLAPIELLPPAPEENLLPPTPTEKLAAIAGGGTVEAPRGEAAVAAGDERLHRFKATVERVNERARRAVGLNVFAGVRPLGGGGVELTATEAWLAAPEVARRTNLDALSRFWRAIHEPHVPIVVRVVNDRGEVIMEKRSATLPPSRWAPAVETLASVRSR